MSDYQPAPLDLSEIDLPECLGDVVEQLAEHVHEVWASERLADGWTLGPERSDEAKEHLKNYFGFIHEFRDKYFGNARTVRSIVLDAIKNQNLRLAELSAKEREKTVLNELTLADVESFQLNKDNFIFNKKTIGFKRSAGEGA